MARLASLVITSIALLVTSEAAEPVPGPGFSNENGRTPGLMLSNVSTDPSDDDARTVVMDYINGYLMMSSRSVASDDQNSSNQVWDISDPTAPFEIMDARFGNSSLMHSSVMLLPHHQLNHNTWLNVSDPLNIFMERPPEFLAGNLGGRGTSAIPYQYSNSRIYDARIGQDVASLGEHGFDGTPTPIGNLLVISGLRGQARAVATYDISDPVNPALLDVIAVANPVWQTKAAGYEYAIWKNYFAMAKMVGGSDCAFVSFEDPTYLKYTSYIRDVDAGGGVHKDLPGRSRYMQFQDNYMFLGSGKYDMSPLDSGNDPTLDLEFYEQCGEYLLPMGNLIVSAENSDQGRPTDASKEFGLRIFAHQSDADTNPPSVFFHSPADGATFQHVKSRVGLVIHETLDYATINPTTVRVYPSSDPSGSSDIEGTLNFHDKDILTFTPLSDLAQETEYTVMLNRIADVSGNEMLPDSFVFTTSGPSDPLPVDIALITSDAYPAAVAGLINFTASASGGLGNLQYRWDFGDNSPRTVWSSTSGAAYAYTAEGHYTVKVQVKDDSGRYAKTLSIVVTVVDSTAIAATPPMKGNQIIVDEVNRRVWTVNPDNNTVTVIDADTLVKVGEYAVSQDPRSLAQDSHGNIWVTCLDDDHIDILDRNTGYIIDGFQCHPGSRPHDIVFNGDQSFAYVSLKGSGHILRIDAATMDSVLLDAGSTPTALAINSNGDQLLLNRFISPDASGEVLSFTDANSASFGLDTTIALQKDTTSDDDGDSGRGLPNYLADIVISPNNQFAFVSSKKDNIDRGTSSSRSGEALTFETTTRAIVSKIDLNTGAEIFEDRIDIDNASQPTAMVFSPFGDYLFIAMQGNNEIKVYDAFTESITTTLDTGLAPQGMCFDSTTLRLFIKNLNDRSVTVYDLEDSFKYGWVGEPLKTTITTVGTEVFTAGMLLGKQIFYNAADERMTAQGYISCAVCHQDGDHDGRTYDFTDRGEGLRNNISLRGRAGIGHGTVHWSGNFDEIQDFELDIRNAFDGTGFIEGAVSSSLGTAHAGRSVELDALAEYVASLSQSSIEESPYKEMDGSLTIEGIAGKELFESLSCVSCHNPATNYTDSVIGTPGVRHDVGTIKASSGQRLGGLLDGIDTPTLMGVHASAPYFHDGSAATLEEVFDHTGNPARSGENGGAHDLDGTYGLTAQEVGDLIAYIKQIDAAADDETAPLVPDNVTTTPSSNLVSLDWADSTKGDFSSYTIYRSELAGDSNPAVLVAGLTSSQYDDATAVNYTTYYYTIVAFDEAGNASGSSVEVSATPQATSQTLQILNPVADAYVRGGSNANKKYGSEELLESKISSNESNTRQTYLRFDLSSVAGSVDSAVLRLKTASSSGTDTHTAYFVGEDGWVESEITWSNKPAGSIELDAAETLDIGSWLELDVTDQVAAELAGNQAISLVIISSNSSHIRYHSREAATESDRPQLVVEATQMLDQVNQPPAFSSDPINKANGDQNTAYSGSIAADAEDPESDPMTFSKVSGPSWLTVASDGSLSGTPETDHDVGANVFSVQVNATGGSDTATLNINVLAAVPTTHILNPVSDAYVRGGNNANKKYGSELTLEVKESSASVTRHSYLRFDLSSISGSVDAATLRLKPVSGTVSNTHSVYFVSDDSWIESEINFNNKPTGAAVALDSSSVSVVGSWLELNVTAQMAIELAGDRPLSLVIISSSGSHIKYHSREATTESDRPQLVVDMTL